jgi:N,N'-diacetyllegionaminate synthase
MKKNKIIIIAEAGVNHNGKLSNAIKLVDIASKAGADFIKFQTFLAENLVTKKAPKAKYQISNTGKKETQYEMLKKIELKRKHHKILINYCKSKNIKFLSTGFSIDDVKFLISKCNIDTIKIPSGEITNYPYLKFIGKLNKKVFMSTGMANIKEINFAYKTLIKNGTKKQKIFVMHCITEYPAENSILNLRSIEFLKEELKTKQVGYSDHSTSVIAPAIAVSLGAKIIEKHFTINKDMKGPDHKASLNPKELKLMIKNIRETEMMLGKKKKIISKRELDNAKIARKSIVANINILKGEIFTEKNLTTKRPGTGISPTQWLKIIGKRAKKNFKINESIK